MSSTGPTAFEAEIAAVFADLVMLLGLPKSMGEIYGFIFASSEPPTFADIEHKLGLSKGSVSQGLRALRELGAVREAGSMEQGAGSMEQGAGSMGQGAGSMERGAAPEAGNETTQVSDLRAQPSAASQATGLSHQVSSSTAPRSALPAQQARATRWVATTELRQLIGNLLRERLTPYLERQDQRMEQAEAALAAEAGRLSPKDHKALQKRLTKLQTWQSRARTVLPVLGKML